MGGDGYVHWLGCGDHISKYQAVHLKYIQFLFVNYISIKLFLIKDMHRSCCQITTYLV